jgi:hypothetical protein
MKRNLKSVDEFAASTPFTKGQLRFWLFDRANNGLDAADAVVKVGRRIYIDADAFERWIDSQQRHKPKAAA